MRACYLKISNFRGIRSATMLLPEHGVLIGDNNTGKTTILEALNLVLGPDRLSGRGLIDEHDFFRGAYLPQTAAPSVEEERVPDDDDVSEHPAEDEVGELPMIRIDAVIVDLSDEQKGEFAGYIEFWNKATNTIVDGPPLADVDACDITEALRVTFRGWYDRDEDDFEAKTYFTRSLDEDDPPEPFSRKHKQICGFLYLRSLRTGTRALSLERGSLLDIILRLKEVRPQMWEDTLLTLGEVQVASDPEIGISPVLESINTALKKYVPKEWGVRPHLKVSSLTREHLRRVITAFIATGDGDHAAPFYRQGTGTINMLVLAMLSQIAQDKQNVIFAMEEPETAVPPYAQKRIVHEVRKLSSQTLFTSHSPYVLEEFEIDETVVLGRDREGDLERKAIAIPANVKQSRYRREFRTRFCEGLLARRVVVAEGATEAAAFPVACRHLAELNPDTYASLEELGVCVVEAGGETHIPGIAKLYKDLGKKTFAVCDKQSDPNKANIEEQVDLLLMHDENGFEDMVMKGTTMEALQRFTEQTDFPPHLAQKHPDPMADVTNALWDYFNWSKANRGIADFIAQCREDEIPEWLRDAAVELKNVCQADEVQVAVPVASEEFFKADGNETD